MEIQGIIAILSLAFGLGMLHALDADHVMAVTGLSSTRPGWRTSVKFCSRWAIGHGLSLLVIGSAVLLFGMAIPEELSDIAESLVGVVLIIIGIYVVWDLLHKNAHLHFHDHDGFPKHAHWHVHDKTVRLIHHHHSHDNSVHCHEPHNQISHNHEHGAIMVGMLHGVAGSAPLLALIPLSNMGSPWIGVLYIVVFGLGVLAAMLLFGGVLGGVYKWLSRWGDSMVRFLRFTVGLSSIGFGSYLLLGMTW